MTLEPRLFLVWLRAYLLVNVSVYLLYYLCEDQFGL